MKNIKTNRLDCNSLIKDYNLNMRPMDICKKYDISNPTMRKILRSYGAYKERKHISDDEIIDTYNNVQKIHKTSLILGCKDEKVKKVLKKHNMPQHKSCKKVKIGDRFNRFTIIGVGIPKRSSDGTSVKMLICKCDCGTIRVYSSSSLRSGKKTSCGCIMKEKTIKRQFRLLNKKTQTLEEKNKQIEEKERQKQEKLKKQQIKKEELESLRYHIGDKVNRWTILSNESNPQSESIKNKDKITAICECGSIKTTTGFNIKQSQSCGCYQKEKSTKNGLYRKNDKEKMLMYSRYKNMKRRCYNIMSEKYIDYGMRGITICDKWMDPNGQGFVNFCKDMGPRPGPSYSIDRIDNNGNYEPSNCQWATASQQSRNQRRYRRMKSPPMPF